MKTMTESVRMKMRWKDESECEKVRVREVMVQKVTMMDVIATKMIKNKLEQPKVEFTWIWSWFCKTIAEINFEGTNNSNWVHSYFVSKNSD